MHEPKSEMSSAGPRTSVILPIYNSSETIVRALTSLLIQSDQDFEVLIIDDGSRDDGLEKAKRLCGDDARVRFIGPRSNTGPSVARNVAISLAKAEWLALLDADDAWMPDRLEQLHRNTSDADFIADDLQLFDIVAGLPVGTMFSGFQVNTLTLETHLADWPTKHADTGYLKPMIRRRFLTNVGLLYDPDVRHGEDYLLYTLALVRGARFRLIPSAGYIYSLVTGPASGQKSPFSHTVVNGSLLAARLSQIPNSEPVALTRRQARLIHDRAELLERSGELDAFRSCLQARDAFGVISAVLSNRFVRRRLVGAARRRICSRVEMAFSRVGPAWSRADASRPKASA